MKRAAQENRFYLKCAQAGFTLIELLIVIVILGILGGIVVSVINPAEQQRRAREAVLRANVEKICVAANSCLNSRENPRTSCDTFEKIGVKLETQTTNSYEIGYEEAFGSTTHGEWDGFLGYYVTDTDNDGSINFDINYVASDGGCMYNCHLADSGGSDTFELIQGKTDGGYTVPKWSDCALD